MTKTNKKMKTDLSETIKFKNNVEHYTKYIQMLSLYRFYSWIIFSCLVILVNY